LVTASTNWMLNIRRAYLKKNDISLFTENFLSTLYNPNVNGFSSFILNGTHRTRG